ncbi:MAG: exopolyphosphatase, partial [Shewanella sp.]
MDTNYYAAVDLGSNSFHMVIAHLSNGRFRIIDRIKERVRLAEGMDSEKTMAPAAMARGLNCLALFGERLKNIAPENIRIAGTYTLRAASNSREFIQDAAKVLQHPIEIISGQEEARLIYQGVAHTQHITGRALVIDIGGGSTELIIGENFTPLALTSRKMGCVSFTSEFFADGKLSECAFSDAQLAAEHQLAPILQQYQPLGWQNVLGSSGSIRAVREVLAAEGWGDGVTITAAGLQRLKEAMIGQKRQDKLSLKGLSADRQPVFAAAVAILLALFNRLALEQLEYSDGALREGLLYEFEERLQHHDIRERTTLALSAHYHLDAKQGERVAQTALALFDALATQWDLPSSYRPLLGWAAYLHEIGMAINYSGIHRHSAYILQNADLPGFNQEEQTVLASLARFSRKALKLAELPPLLSVDLAVVHKLIRLLRLSVAVHHMRRRDLNLPWQVSAQGASLTVALPRAWAEAHRLLTQNLSQEQAYCAQANWPLHLLWL